MAAIVTADATSVLISPYFLNTTNSTSRVQTPILLNGVNYERWSKLFVNAMRMKRKLGFFYGTLKKPAEGDDVEKWLMVNSMVIGWIYASVEPKLCSSISLVDNASDMWSNIKNRYEVGDGTKEHQLHADLTACKQDEDRIEDYFARLKLIWDAIANVDNGLLSCCCGQSGCTSMKKYQKKQEQLQIHLFLMGLSSQRFSTTRSNLLVRIHELNLDGVYSQIIQEERHLNAVIKEQDRVSAIGLNVTASANSVSRQSLVCTHCGKVGHEKSGCFKIIGYPEWYEENTPSNHSSAIRY